MLIGNEFVSEWGRNRTLFARLRARQLPTFGPPGMERRDTHATRRSKGPKPRLRTLRPANRLGGSPAACASVTAPRPPSMFTCRRFDFGAGPNRGIFPYFRPPTGARRASRRGYFRFYGGFGRLLDDLPAPSEGLSTG